MLKVMSEKGITANVDNEWDGNGIGRVSLRKPENYLTLAVSPGMGDALKTPEISLTHMEVLRSWSNRTLILNKEYKSPPNVTHMCQLPMTMSWFDRISSLTKRWMKYIRGDADVTDSDGKDTKV